VLGIFVGSEKWALISVNGCFKMDCKQQMLMIDQLWFLQVQILDFRIKSWILGSCLGFFVHVLDFSFMSWIISSSLEFKVQVLDCGSILEF
jgi:hypothetical protein